jgi:L-lactate dehydrogenase
VDLNIDTLQQVAASSVQLSALGMHGDSQVVAWSAATINGVPIDEFLKPDEFTHADLAEECKDRTESIILAKGSTPFGIGSAVASICSSILFDKGDVRPISHLHQEFGCCFSSPVVLGRKGIVKAVQMPLSSDEKADIVKSAKKLKDTLDRIKHQH